MNARHRIACCCLALALGACRQTVVFDRQAAAAGAVETWPIFARRRRGTPWITRQRTPELIVALDWSWSMGITCWAPANITELEAALASLDAASDALSEALVRLGFVEFPGASYRLPATHTDVVPGLDRFFFGDACRFN